MAITGCLDAATYEAPVFFELRGEVPTGSQQLLAVSRLAYLMHAGLCTSRCLRLTTDMYHSITYYSRLQVGTTRGLNLTENSEAHGTRSRSKARGL